MFRLLMTGLFKLREVFQNAASRYFQRLRKSDGKLKYVSPEGARKILVIGSITFFSIVIVSQLINRDRYLSNSFSDYEKEVKSDAGLRMRDFSGKALFDKNGLSTDKAVEQDGGLDVFQTTAAQNPNNPAENPVNSSNFISDTSGTVEVQASDCLALVDQAKSAKALSVSERLKLRSCVEKSTIPLSTEERGALLSLSSGELTQPEREAILRSLNDKASPIDKDLSNVIAATLDPDKKQELADGLNKEFKEDSVQVMPDETRALSKVVSSDQKTYSEAIAGTSKIVSGQSPDEREKGNLLEAIKNVKGGAVAELENPNLSSDKEKAIKSLLDDVGDRQAKIEEMEQRLGELQARAREPVERLQKGLSLSKEEQAIIDDLSRSRKDLDQLKAVQEKRQRTLIELTSRLQKTVAQAAMALQKTIPSGVFEGYADYEPIDCKNLKPLPIAKRKKKDGVKAQKLALNEKPALNFYKLEDEARKNGVEYEGKRLDPSAFLGDQKISIADLFVAKGDNAKAISLGPETKIAAILDSEIIVAANSPGQSVRIKILQDVYDAKNRQLIIPRNSLVVGRTSGFDENTGIMEFSLNRVSVGSGNTFDIPLRVGSGDGSMGLKGQVRDSRGRFLLGAFVTAFTAGALDFVSQNTISQYQQSKQLVTALQGSALSGGAEVATKISNMFANDLMNTPSVFYAPRGLPIVLYPEN